MAEAPELVIRPVAPADSSAVESLLTTVWVGEGFTPVGMNPFGDVAHRAQAARLLVAEEAGSGRIVGTILLVPPGTPYTLIAQEGELEARQLAVDIAARGQGVARRLIEATMRIAAEEGATRLVLSMQERMMAAQRLYERLGFERLPARDWFRPQSGRHMLVYAKATAASEEE